MPLDFNAPIPSDQEGSGPADVEYFVAIRIGLGGTTVDGMNAPLDADVERMVKEAVAKSPSTRFIVSASSTVPYGQLIHLLDLIRMAGARKAALGFEKPPSPP